MDKRRTLMVFAVNVKKKWLRRLKMKNDNRPYIYAHELNGKWSLVLRANDRDEMIVTNVDRKQAIQVVAKQRVKNA